MRFFRFLKIIIGCQDGRGGGGHSGHRTPRSYGRGHGGHVSGGNSYRSSGGCCRGGHNSGDRGGCWDRVSHGHGCLSDSGHGLCVHGCGGGGGHGGHSGHGRIGRVHGENGCHAYGRSVGNCDHVYDSRKHVDHGDCGDYGRSTGRGVHGACGQSGGHSNQDGRDCHADRDHGEHCRNKFHFIEFYSRLLELSGTVFNKNAKQLKTNLS